MPWRMHPVLPAVTCAQHLTCRFRGHVCVGACVAPPRACAAFGVCVALVPCSNCWMLTCAAWCVAWCSTHVGAGALQRVGPEGTRPSILRNATHVRMRAFHAHSRADWVLPLSACRHSPPASHGHQFLHDAVASHHAAGACGGGCQDLEQRWVVLHAGAGGSKGYQCKQVSVTLPWRCC